jgi:osmotically-inducible protein OsmY
VHSEAERTKAVQLARETDGVTQVHDRLVIR